MKAQCLLWPRPGNHIPQSLQYPIVYIGQSYAVEEVITEGYKCQSQASLGVILEAGYHPREACMRGFYSQGGFYSHDHI